MLKTFLGRIYTDYLEKGRWNEYRAFLIAAQNNDYEFVCHQDAVEALERDSRRLFFLRHDIDSDVPIAWDMFRIEKELGIKSTYYFRRCTADSALMREIAETGSEVGYHYEEISDYAKANGVKTRQDALECMEEIRRLFLVNLTTFERTLGRKVHTIAAHGDWINRRLGIVNYELLNEEIRTTAGISLEAYDQSLNGRISFRAADAMYPTYWRPSSPMEAILSHLPYLLLLVHPRQWQRAPVTRPYLDFQRLIEEIQFRCRRT